MAKEKKEKESVENVAEKGTAPAEEKKQASYRFVEPDRKQSRDKKKELESKYSVKKNTPKRIAIIVLVCLVTVGIIAAGVCIGATGVLSAAKLKDEKGETFENGNRGIDDVDEIKYSVSFVSDFGKGSAPTSLKKAKNERIRLPMNTFIYEGYEFQGWEYGSELYKANAEFVMPGKDVTFKAVWKKVHDVGFEFELLPSGDAYSITGIGTCELDEITLPSSHGNENFPVVMIGDNAFEGCTFSTVHIPDGICEIGNGAFKDCVNLKGIDIPESVYSVGEGAFYGCSALDAVGATEQLVYLGKNAFHNTKWYDGQSDGQIYVEKVFYTYKGVAGKDVALKDGTISIASFALEQQNSLESVSLPASVIYVPGNFVSQCDKLTSFSVDVENKKYTASNNAILFPDEKSIVAGCKTTVIPTDGNVVDKIAKDAFFGRTALTSLTIPENVTTIAEHAFDGSGLTEVNIHKNMLEIKNGAFDNLKSLTAINFNAENCNADAKCFDYANFVGCADGVILTVGDDVKVINGGIFSGSGSIVAVNFEEHCEITTLGVNAFKGCYNSNFTRFDIPSTVTTLCTGCFANTQLSTLGLTWLLIPDTVTNIEKGFATSNSGVKRIFCSVTEENKPDGWVDEWDLFDEKKHESSYVYWSGQWWLYGGVPTPFDM